MSEMMEWRSAELGRVDASERVIEIMVAPYGDTAPLAGGGERYTRGVFGEPGQVALKLEIGHGHAGPVIGRSIGFRDTAEGLIGSFKVSATPAGDDALTLAADGALGGSAGFIPGERERAPDGATLIRSGDLREVTLTGTPAYTRARVMAVRSTMEEPMADNTDTTREVADNTTDDRVTEAVTRALDEYRAGVAASEAPAAPPLEVNTRAHNYRSIGEVVADTIAHARRSSPAATERLTSLIDAGVVSASGDAIAVREFSGIGNSVGDSTPNNLYVPELLTLLREGRPVANLFNARALPQEGNTLQTPEVTDGSRVGYQDGEGTAVVNQVQSWILRDWKKATIAGGQGVTVQAARWSSPNYLEEVVRDLLADYTEFLDSETINGDPATGTPISGTGFTGILNAGATDVPVTGGVAAALALIGAGWAAVYQGSRRAPIAAIMASAVWGAFLDLSDSDGRPLISTEAPSNPAGIGDAASVVGTLRGIPVVVDESTPTDVVILGSFRDALLFEDAGTPAQITLTYPSNLVTDVSVHGFATCAIRRPGAFAVLSGITA